MNSLARKEVIAFLLLTFVLCLPFYLLIISSGAASGLYVIAIMWCPGIAALLTRLWFQGNLRGTGWRWGAWRYPVISYAAPLLVCLGVYGLTWATGLGGVDGGRLVSGTGPFGWAISSVPLAVIVIGTLAVAEGALFTTGEELGWRGLLLPELVAFQGYTRASLISGAVCSVYHYPLIFFADYHSRAPRWYATLLFTIMVFSVSFIAAWIRLRSGSVWPAVIMHASHNVFSGMFNQITVPNRWTEYVTTEFGAGLAIVYVLVACWCYRHRDAIVSRA